MILLPAHANPIHAQYAGRTIRQPRMAGTPIRIAPASVPSPA